MTTEGSSSTTGFCRLVGHSSIYAMGNIARQLAGFLMLPVYTRYLTPADYGVVGLITFALSLAEVLFGARLGQAIPKYYFDAHGKLNKNKVISTAMIITGVLSAGTSFALVLLRVPASQGLFGTSEYASIVGLFAPQMITLAMESYCLLFIRLQERPWLFVSLSLGKLVLQLSMNIWLVVYKGMGVMGIAISSISVSSFVVLILLFYTLRQVGWRFDRDLARQMLKYCWPLWISGFAGLYIGSANRYYLRIFTSLDAVGLFELATKFSAVIPLLIWDPFMQYWQIERFKYYQRGNAEPVYQKVFLVMSTLMVLTALTVGILAGPVIRFMSDAKFYPAVYAVPFLAFDVVFDKLALYFNFSWLVTGKTGWIGRNNYLIAAIITVFYLSLIPLAGYIGAALAIMLAHAAQLLIVHRASARFYDMKILLKPFWVTVAISAFACWMANGLMARDILWEDLVAKIFILLFAWAFILMPIMRNRDNRQYITRIVSMFLKIK